VTGWLTVTGRLTQKIRVEISKANGLSESAVSRFAGNPDDAERKSAGFLVLNGWGLAENSMRPTIDIGLRPDIYEAFLAAFTSPNDGHPGHIRRLRVIPWLPIYSWDYDAFCAAMRGGGMLSDWALPLRAVVTWNQWNFGTSPS